MSRNMKKFLSLSTFLAGIGATAYYGCNQHANSVIKDSLSEKKSFFSKLMYFFPDYLYGKGAKKTLIDHQLDNGRDEEKNVYSKFINERISNIK